MNTKKQPDLDRLGLRSETGFPYEAYCFTDGQLSLQVEQNGGINELHFLSMRKTAGRVCIETPPLPILSKRHVRNYSYGLYGPVLRFVSTTRAGRNLYHVPDRVLFLPFGFTSSSDRFGAHMEYDLCMRDRTVLCTFRNTAKDRRTLDLLLCLPGLAEGDFGSGLAPDEFIEASRLYENGKPVPTPVHYRRLRWSNPELDKTANALIAAGRADRVATNQTDPRLACGESFGLALGADAPLRVARREPDYLLLSLDWAGRDALSVALVLESDRETCVKRLRALWRDPAAPWRAQTRRYAALAASIPEIRIGDSRSEVPRTEHTAAKMARTIPLFLNAMRVFESGTQSTVRAATHKFGYFPGWDVQWPARAFLVWGQYDMVRKILNHALDLVGWLEPWFQCEVFVLLAEYYALTRDRAFLKTAYARARPFYRAILASGDRHGFGPCGHYGADNPGQLKHMGTCYTPDSVGWTFQAARAMENLALTLGDADTATRSRDISGRIRAAYLKVFYDTKVGYLASAVDAKTLQQVDTYQNVSTMAMEAAYGDLLLDSVLPQLAAFQKRELYHPGGRASVPYWNRTDEMWRSCIMLQHAQHEARTARYGGEPEELLRMWQVYMDLFEKCQLQLETINLCGMPGDPTGQRADWQAFGASAQYLLLLHAVLGLELDYGGLTYIPCDTPVEATVHGLRIGESTWDVTLSGAGAWVESIEVDGIAVHGALKTPSVAVRRGRHTLLIRRGPQPPTGPCLLRAVGAGVTIETATGTRLVAALDGTGRIPVRFYAPRRPRACRVNGSKRTFEWNPDRKTGLVEVIVSRTARLDVQN